MDICCILVKNGNFLKSGKNGRKVRRKVSKKSESVKDLSQFYIALSKNAGAISKAFAEKNKLKIETLSKKALDLFEDESKSLADIKKNL